MSRPFLIVRYVEVTTYIEEFLLDQVMSLCDAFDWRHQKIIIRLSYLASLQFEDTDLIIFVCRMETS